VGEIKLFYNFFNHGDIFAISRFKCVILEIKNLSFSGKKDQDHFPLAASEIVGHGIQPFDMGLMDTQLARFESPKTVLVSIGPNLVHSKQGIVQEDIPLNFKIPYINCSKYAYDIAKQH
jgi:hypothetical protein